MNTNALIKASKRYIKQWANSETHLVPSGMDVTKLPIATGALWSVGKTHYRYSAYIHIRDATRYLGYLHHQISSLRRIVG